MNVLSLFDGISCGQQALKELGIPVEKYYASEIEKHPIAITQYNFPDTIQLGDVTKWREWDIDWASIDLLTAGFPCQSWSTAGKQQGDNDPRGALVHDLIAIWKHIQKHNPNVKFLFENVRMKKEFLDYIDGLFGVPHIRINAALVSAQNRDRCYWTNIGTIEQPEDRGILLRDVLEEDGVAVKDKGQTILATIYKENAKSMLKRNKLGLCCQVGEANLKGHDSIKRVYSQDGKSPTLTTMGGGHREPKVVCGAYGKIKTAGLTTQRLEIRNDAKTNTLTTVQKDNVVVRDKSKCVRSWRKLTTTECERLQTLPDNFTAFGDYNTANGKTPPNQKPVSKTQRYRALGNGWTVEVIKHIFSSIAKEAKT